MKRSIRLLFATLIGFVLSYGAENASVSAAKKKGRLTAQRRIAAVLKTDGARTARWGILAQSLQTGRVAYTWNANEHFLPASNTKLFSTALAMARLGPDYRFVTTVRAANRPDANGIVRGDLRLVGGGDPTLSGRAYPYNRDDDPTNLLEPIEQLAAQLQQAGVREIAGDIVGDDRLYVYQPYPEGWTIDDAQWEYGAPVSALVFNDNAFTLSLHPGAEAGDLARVVINPPSLPLFVDNRVLTASNGKVHLERSAGSRQIRLTGTIAQGRGRYRQWLAVDDPALYAAHVLHDVLTRKGIRVWGEPAVRHRYRAEEPFDPSEGVELARRVSPPLVEVAQVVNKVSQNLHAEILLREVARVRGSEPTREAGLKQLDEFLQSVVGVDGKEYHFEDGSGLSRRTLVSPAAIVKLLKWSDRQPYREQWDALLPLGGEDGTLRSRFDQARAARAIHAKTGTLANANALSGYLTTKRGARLVFSIVANNHTVPTSEIRKAVDRIGLALVDWEGR